MSLSTQEEDSSEDSEDDESVAAPVQPPEQTHAKPKLDTPHSSNLPAAGIENYEMVSTYILVYEFL